jgi:O6-methylguanine-DNA--protein-cysteine methyltransferase
MAVDIFPTIRWIVARFPALQALQINEPSPGERYAANALAAAMPCRRIVAEVGGLFGYRRGMERNRALLEKEEYACMH